MNDAKPKYRLSEFVHVIDGTDGGMLFLNPLSGKTIYIDANDVSLPPQDIFLSDENLKKLISSGMVRDDSISERAIFEEMCCNNREDGDTRNSFRIGFLLDDLLNSKELSMALGAAKEEIESRTEGKLFIHFWAFCAPAFKLIPDILNELTPSHLLECDITISLDGSFSSNDETEIIVERISSLFVGSAQVTFALHRSALKIYNGTQEYAHTIFLWQSLFSRFRFSPAFIFFISVDDVSIIANQLYEDLCFSGIYPRNIHFAFVGSPLEHSALFCEMYNHDGNFIARALNEILSKPTHKIVEPFALGYADSLRIGIKQNNLWPRTFFCPYTRPTLFFAKNLVGACPVALSKASSGDKKLLPLLMSIDNIEPLKRTLWQQRGPHTINSCRNCRSAPLCGSGCPLVAYENNGTIDSPDCPPITQLNESLAKSVASDYQDGTTTL